MTSVRRVRAVRADSVDYGPHSGPYGVIRLFGLVLLVMVMAGSVADAALRAGAARVSIVPPFPTQMGGFHDRVKDFEGVHDELFARAAVLDDGATKLVLIGSDLMAIDAEMVKLIREGITAAIGIPASHVMVCCTHNHSAPSYYQKTEKGQDDEEPSLKKFLTRQFVAAAEEAHKTLRPAKAGFAAGQLVGATRNRQQKNEVIDPQVGVIRIEQLEDRQTIATLFNFTGHPVIIGSQNLLLSGEYPGAASRAVENLLGGVAVFTQGACGDITVNRSGDPFQEIERLGRTVAGEVIKTSGLITLTENFPLRSAAKELSLPARKLPSVDEAKAALEKGKAALELSKQQKVSEAAIRLQEDKNRVLSMAVVMAQAVADNPSRRKAELPGEVQVFQLGDVMLGAIPGEIFVEYALELRSRVKQESGKSFCLVGYANGYLGYIVTPRATETGGYEASVTRLDVPAGRLLTEGVMELVLELSRPVDR